MERPRQITTLCLALGALEVLRIIASVLFGFVLSSSGGQYFFSGPGLSLVLSCLLLVSLCGVFSLKRWGLYGYLCVQLIIVGLYLTYSPIPLFAIAFTLLLLGLLGAAVFPYREQFR